MFSNVLSFVFGLLLDRELAGMVVPVENAMLQYLNYFRSLNYSNTSVPDGLEVLIVLVALVILIWWCLCPCGTGRIEK